jgi:acetyltransferase-like isoleucine patch superfamily enzyme
VTFASQYKVPKAFYWQMARRVSVVKTAWYSARFRGPVVVGRGSRLRIARSATLDLAPGATLLIGIAHDSPSGAVVRLHPRSSLAVGGRVQLMRSCTVTVGYDARLTIGAGTFFNDGASVVCDQQVAIGADCAISWGVRIMDTDVHRLVRGGVAVANRAPVTIGDHCWIGAGATILKGAFLGIDCVVGAGSVVTGTSSGAELLLGSPAKARESQISWRH